MTKYAKQATTDGTQFTDIVYSLSDTRLIHVDEVNNEVTVSTTMLREGIDFNAIVDTIRGTLLDNGVRSHVIEEAVFAAMQAIDRVLLIEALADTIKFR